MQNMGRHSCQRSAILWKTSQAGSTSVMTLQTRYTKSTNHILKHCKNCDLCPLSPFDCHKWYDLNSSICQELSSLSQSQKIIIALLCCCHFYCFFAADILANIVLVVVVICHCHWLSFSLLHCFCRCRKYHNTLEQTCSALKTLKWKVAQLIVTRLPIELTWTTKETL